MTTKMSHKLLIPCTIFKKKYIIKLFNIRVLNMMNDYYF